MRGDNVKSKREERRHGGEKMDEKTRRRKGNVLALSFLPSLVHPLGPFPFLVSATLFLPDRADVCEI